MAKNKKQRREGARKPEREDTFERILPQDYSDSRRVEKVTEQIFRIQAERIRKLDSKGAKSWAFLDMDSVRLKRKRRATLRTMERVREQVGDICPDAEPKFYIVEEWAKLNAAGMPAYDLLEQEHCLSLAAAIWMLDRIRENRKWHQALELLPMDDGALNEIDIPDVYDLCYSGEFLAAMVCVIQERNNDCVGLSAKKKQSDSRRVFADEYTAAGKQHQDVPSRQRFEALLALIDEEAIQAAAAHFEEKLWEWTRRYYACRADSARQERVFAKEYNALADKANQGMQELQQKMQENQRRQQAKASALPVIPLAAPAREEKPLSGDPQKTKFSGLSLAIDVVTEGKRLHSASEKLEDKISDLRYDALFYCTASREQLTESLGEQAAEQLAEFEPGDPYELCFALLYLLDTDSDLPWLYYPGAALMKCAAARLPWYFIDYDAVEDEFWPDSFDDDDADDADDAPEDWKADEEDDDAQAGGNTGEGDAAGTAHRSASVKKSQVPELLDWYRPDYTLRTHGNRRTEPSNLAQILYSVTGCVLPRNEHRYDAAAAVLAQYGITGKKMLVPLLHCISLLGEGRHQLQDWRLLQALAFAEDEGDAPGEETEKAWDDGDAAPERNQETIRRLKAENDRLKQSLHEATREARDAKRKLDAQTENWERDRQELQDFRELFFRQGEEEESSAAPAGAGITYPCRTEKRTVVFGGHDSWAKAIKPLLPEVRFVPRESLPNPDLIRNAEVVWIQPNALGHKHYYKIIDVARTYHIPVRYFGYASAEKCAEQLVEADRK